MNAQKGGREGSRGRSPFWIIETDIETDYWLQKITNWDRGDYWKMDPEVAYHTLDDSLIVNLPIQHVPPPDPPRTGKRRMYRVV